jgi:hypothetical protein
MYDYDMVVIGSGPSGRRAERSEAILSLGRAMDGFAEPVTGRAFARPVGSQ